MQVRIKDGLEAELLISELSSWQLFDELAAAIAAAFAGTWVVKLDGIDQRYWELQVGSAVVTLHLEHYLGISLFPAESASDVVASRELVHRIGDFLRDFDASA